MKGFTEVSSEQLNEDLNRLLKFGEKPGISTGHKQIDEHYTVLEGGVTDITGWPGSGKTLLLDDILMSLSQNHGKKHLLYVPDSGNHQNVYARLIHKLTGKTFRKGYDNRITETEMYNAMAWIHEHFKVLVKNDFKQRLSPYEFWNYAIKEGYDSAVIDSWNFMKHEQGGGTQYLAEVLSYRNELAENNNIHFFTIIHPRNPTDKDYNSEGVLQPASEYTLMGGSEWNNNGKNILSIHKESKDADLYKLSFRKIKPDIVGLAGGFVEFEHDWKQRRVYFYENGKRQYAVKTMFAEQQAEIEETPVDEQAFHSNSSFSREEDDNSIPF
jgi:hypothetical protein